MLDMDPVKLADVRLKLAEKVLRKAEEYIAIVHHLNREICFEELPLPKAVIAYITETVMPKLYTYLPQEISSNIGKYKSRN